MLDAMLRSTAREMKPVHSARRQHLKRIFGIARVATTLHLHRTVSLSTRAFNDSEASSNGDHCERGPFFLADHGRKSSLNASSRWMNLQCTMLRV